MTSGCASGPKSAGADDAASAEGAAAGDSPGNWLDHNCVAAALSSAAAAFAFAFASGSADTTSKFCNDDLLLT